MVRPLRKFYKGGFWHTYNRGVAKQEIFREQEDYAFYLYKTKEVLKKYPDPVAIHAYNLLDNHIHHLVEQISNKATPSKFFATLHTSLGVHINKKYNRGGPLFQDRFKAKVIEKDDYLLGLSIYIHLNKILEKLQHTDRSLITKSKLQELLKEAEDDPWNSYAVYLGLREDGITQDKFILSLISDDIKKAREEYRKLAKKMLISGTFLKVRHLTFEDSEELL